MRPLELLKSAYGVVNAPLLWYQELKTALLGLGFIISPLDPCLFVLPKRKVHHQDPKDACGIHGILGVHVDDGLGGGDAVFALKPLISSRPDFLLEVSVNGLLCSLAFR